MMQNTKLSRFGFFLAAVLVFALCLPPVLSAQQSVEDLKEEVETLREKIEKMEKNQDWNTEDIGSLMDRVDETEMHTATDKISFDVDFRTRADSIHYNDIRMAPSSLVNRFFDPVPTGIPETQEGFEALINSNTPAQLQTMLASMPDAGFDGANLAQIQGLIALMQKAGAIPAADKYDADNDIIYTNRLRLNMMGKLNRHVEFRGRLAAYKVFGDSTGVKFNQGSLGDITLDGNTSSTPHGDTIRMERAYFVYKNDIGDVPYSFSAGRRPSTEGPPLEYRNYSMVGGSPLATVINWQFDGASLSFNLEDVTGIPGASFKFCYGLGYENDWGNSNSLNYSGSDLEDVHMFGIISDLYDNGKTSLMLNYAHAWDVTDGFTGLTVMPFIVTKNADGTYTFEQNTGGFISRLEPQTNIGDWDAASLLLRSAIETPNDKIDWFLAGSWSHTNPSQVSQNPFYEILGQGLLSSNGNLEDRDGYSIYAGAVCPVPVSGGRLGLEYNYGSKYWFNFTGAEDSLIGSKLAARGEVYEAYYVHPVYDSNFFFKLGGQFYDYKYTGSGNPLGKPVRISETTALDTINPVVDEVWNYYLSANLRF